MTVIKRQLRNRIKFEESHFNPSKLCPSWPLQAHPRTENTIAKLPVDKKLKNIFSHRINYLHQKTRLRWSPSLYHQTGDQRSNDH
jgi:hypothetical protein